MRVRLGASLVLAATLVPMAAGFAVEASGAGAGPPPLGPGVVTVELGIRHSRFSSGEIRVRPGTLVRFVVTNDDPIRHELIVGDDDVHAAHEAGHESFHPPVPGEVGVDPGESALTVYRFDEPGKVLFVRHLPGHLVYGMKGYVTVTP